MTEFFDAPVLRDVSPLAAFLNNMFRFVRYILVDYVPRIANFMAEEPMILLPIAAFAIITTVGILGRLISKD